LPRRAALPVVEFIEGFPFLVARIERIAEPQATGPDVEARVMKLKERALRRCV